MDDKRKQQISDRAKRAAMTNAALSTYFATTGQPLWALGTGAVAAAGAAIDHVFNKSMEGEKKKR